MGTRGSRHSGNGGTTLSGIQLLALSSEKHAIKIKGLDNYRVIDEPIPLLLLVPVEMHICQLRRQGNCPYQAYLNWSSRLSITTRHHIAGLL